MRVRSNFIERFADYLTSTDRLSFVSAPYKVIAPKGGENRTEGGLSYLFEARMPGDRAPFGYIEVMPKVPRETPPFSHPAPKSFLISSIATDDHMNRYRAKGQGYGLELVRRAVLFAYESGYSSVTTSRFTEDGGSFWFGLGFNNRLPVDKLNRPKARLSQNEEDHKIAALKNGGPKELWTFAASETGRRALWGIPNFGVLSFQAPEQRRFAFKRLRLDHLLGDAA